MDTPKVYRELGVWIAEWPDGTFITADSRVELEQRMYEFDMTCISSSRSQVYAYAVAAGCLIGALVILGLCAVASVL